MGKGNLLQGMGRGKLGDTVFYRTNGVQYYRLRNRVIKNPRTSAQMIQRAVIGTTAKLYSLLKPICDHSWEGVPVGQKSQQMFSKNNVRLLKSEVLSFGGVESLGGRVAASTSFGVPASDFWVSKGSLVNPLVMNKHIEDAEGGTEIGDKTLSALSFMKAGDMLTLVGYAITGDIDMTAELTGIEGNSLASCCLSTPRLCVERIKKNEVSFESADLVKVRTKDLIDKYFTYESEADSLFRENLPFKKALDNGERIPGELCYAIIFSKWDGAKWCRSSEQLSHSSGAFGIFPEYIQQAWAPSAATPSSDLILNGGAMD